MRNQRAAFALVVLGLVSGCSKNLSRTYAEEIIKKNLKPATDELPIGKVPASFDTADGYWTNDPRGRMYRTLADEHLVDAKWLGAQGGLSPFGLMPAPEISIAMTDASAKYVRGEIHSSPFGGVGKFVTVQLCEKELIEVTGITQQGENAASVDWTWKFTNLTPFGEAEAKSLSAGICDASVVHKDSSNMRRYDDGWRVADQ